MIILDTNVVSAVMAPAPSTAVVAWLDGQDSDDLYLTAVTVAEIAYGINALPDGRRRADLTARFASFVARGFDQRVLPFDTTAARAYGEIMAHRRRIGRPMSVLDGQIAAIATVSGASVATRNVRDFDACGLAVVNPFEL